MGPAGSGLGTGDIFPLGAKELIVGQQSQDCESYWSFDCRILAAKSRIGEGDEEILHKPGS